MKAGKILLIDQVKIAMKRGEIMKKYIYVVWMMVWLWQVNVNGESIEEKLARLEKKVEVLERESVRKIPEEELQPENLEETLNKQSVKMGEMERNNKELWKKMKEVEEKKKSKFGIQF